MLLALRFWWQSVVGVRIPVILFRTAARHRVFAPADQGRTFKPKARALVFDAGDFRRSFVPPSAARTFSRGGA